MHHRLKIWQGGGLSDRDASTFFSGDWEEAEKRWQHAASQAASKAPMKSLCKLPKIPGIADTTSRRLRWKSLYWLFAKDHTHSVLRGFLYRPFRYAVRLCRSLFRRKTYRRDGDFFFYALSDEEALLRELNKKGRLLVLGFSYCHKPFECPSGRFTEACIADLSHPICQQCFIGKMVHASAETNTVLRIIPTVHDIAETILSLVRDHPPENVFFMITACEMTLEMFGDWGAAAGVRGVGVRLDGRICNTFRAFVHSERGIKPGLTVVLSETQQRMMQLIRTWKNQTRSEQSQRLGR